MKLFRSNHGVSQIVGFMLTFVIISSVSTVVIFNFNSIMQDRTNRAAELHAESIAGYVVNSLSDAVTAYLNEPKSNYESVIDIPRDIAGKSYYVELTEDRVYVNTTDGQISKSCTNYNADIYGIGCKGRVYSDASKIKVYRHKTDDLYKLDFGTPLSPVKEDYCAVTADDVTSDWDEDCSDFPYRLNLTINNTRWYKSTGGVVQQGQMVKTIYLPSEDLEEFPVSIVLQPTNFNYAAANVSFVNESQEMVYSNFVFYLVRAHDLIKLEYFIEEWNPNYNSVISVLFPVIRKNQTVTVHMYYGYEGDLKQDPDKFLHGIHNISMEEETGRQYKYFNGAPYEDYYANSTYNRLLRTGLVIDKTEVTPPVISGFIPPGVVLNETSSADKYCILQTKLKFVPGEGEGHEHAGIDSNFEILLLSQNSLSDTECYSLDVANTDPFTISGYKNFYPSGSSHPTSVLNASSQAYNLKNRWLKTITYITINVTALSYKYWDGLDLISGVLYFNYTIFQNFFYDFYTSEFLGYLAFYDFPDPQSGEYAFTDGYINFLCGGRSSNMSQYLFVDWAYLKKYNNYVPKVEFGQTIAKNCLWDDDDVDTVSSYDCGSNSVGDLLRDYNHGISESRMIIADLDAGDYTLSITMGDNDTARDNMYVNAIIEYHDGSTSDEMSIISDLDTAPHQFQEKVYTLSLEDAGDITLIFGDADAGDASDNGWAVCAITLEKGFREVKIKQVI